MDRKEFIKKEINQFPDDPFNYYLLGIEFHKEGKITETKRLFEQLLVDFPHYIATYFTYATLLLDENEEDLAETVIYQGIDEAKKIGAAKAQKELQQLLEINF
jgi:tetratricopeptide (TPR) repeat protein